MRKFDVDVKYPYFAAGSSIRDFLLNLLIVETIYVVFTFYTMPLEHIPELTSEALIRFTVVVVYLTHLETFRNVNVDIFYACVVLAVDMKLDASLICGYIYLLVFHWILAFPIPYKTVIS